MLPNRPLLSSTPAPKSSSNKHEARWRTPVYFYGVVLLYIATNCAGLILNQGPDKFNILWPANGILLAIILLSPRKLWLSYFGSACLASVLIYLAFHHSVQISLVYSVANIAEVMVAAALLRRSGEHPPDLTKLPSVGHFVLFAVLFAPLIGALIVALPRNLQAWTFDPLAIYNCFMGDALGIAVMTPMLLAIRPSELETLINQRRGETIALLSILILLALGIFGFQSLPIAFLIFPMVLLLTFRLGPSGASIGIFIVTFIAAWFTAHSRGAFASPTSTPLVHHVFLLQFFICVLIITVYAVSATLAERALLQQELTDAYREASGLAERDHLTGLANRRTFDRELVREWRRAARERGSLSLMMIDVDCFKNYNDLYGHVAGDECLRTIANVLSGSLYRTTDLMARYGGEEFAVILPGSHEEGVQIMAERLRTSILELQIQHDGSLGGMVTISAGVATFRPSQENSFHEQERTNFLKGADSALYAAKQQGRNQVSTWDPTAQEATPA